MSEEVTRPVELPPGSNTVPSLPFADHVAIVGGGFSGALLAINLVRHDGPRVTLIERRAEFARGIAYSTSEPRHLLNVRAANMSALPDEPDHFVQWLRRQGGSVAHDFASRRDYGRYLAELLDQAVASSDGRLQLQHADARSLHWRKGQAEVTLTRGGNVTANIAVLALGNLPPHDPAPLTAASLPASLYSSDPWADDLVAGLDGDDTLLILGTGLTMVDVVLTLDSAGYGGRIVALSRRGLVPRPHAARPAPYEPLAEKPGERGSALVHRIRRDARRIGWRGAVDALRPFSQALWLGASEEDRSRFQRHLRAWWDVHRHRLAPQVAARLEELQVQGKLRVLSGKLMQASVCGNDVQVRYRPRHSQAAEELQVRRIVNCTGPQGDLLRSPEPLLQQLLAAGDIRPDRHNLGVDVNARAEVIGMDGFANPRLLAVGPLTRGAFWEIASVPDIRVQAWNLARRLSGSHWVEGQGL